MTTSRRLVTDWKIVITGDDEIELTVHDVNGHKTRLIMDFDRAADFAQTLHAVTRLHILTPEAST